MNLSNHALPPDPKRLYRNRRHGVIGGVCAGIADYLGWDRTLLRLAVIVTLFIAAPLAVITYIILWIIMPEQPAGLFADEREKRFWQSVNLHPSRTVGDLARKFSDIDRRLAEMERKVASPDYDLDRKFRDLGA